MNAILRPKPLKPPSRLVFQTDCFFGGTSSLQWDGTRLWRFHLDRQSPEFSEGVWVALCPPADADWSTLWRLLDLVDAWHWPTQSNDSMVLDGESWTFKLRWGRHRWSGGGYQAWPKGFKSVGCWFDKLMEAPRIQGIPGPFQVRYFRIEQSWVFQWNGRELAWATSPAPGLPEMGGTLKDLSPHQWSRYMDSCRPVGLLEMTFQDGNYAGLSVRADPPGGPAPDGDGNRSPYSYLDPAGTLDALKALVLNQHPAS